MISRYTLHSVCLHSLRDKHRCDQIAAQYQGHIRRKHLDSPHDSAETAQLHSGAVAFLQDVASGKWGDPFGFAQIWAAYSASAALPPHARSYPLTLISYDAIMSGHRDLACALKTLCLPVDTNRALDRQRTTRNVWTNRSSLFASQQEQRERISALRDSVFAKLGGELQQVPAIVHAPAAAEVGRGAASSSEGGETARREYNAQRQVQLRAARTHNTVFESVPETSLHDFWSRQQARLRGRAHAGMLARQATTMQLSTESSTGSGSSDSGLRPAYGNKTGSASSFRLSTVAQQDPAVITSASGSGSNAGIARWLRRQRLEAFAKPLLSHGVESVDDLRALSIDMLVQMGMTPLQIHRYVDGSLTPRQTISSRV